MAPSLNAFDYHLQQSSCTRTFSTLPMEILLRVLRLLLPLDPFDNTAKTDLQNVRRTSKRLEPIATELFFESWPIYLFQNRYDSPRKSFDLVAENPSLAKLVRNGLFLLGTTTDDRLAPTWVKIYEGWNDESEKAISLDGAKIEIKQRLSMLPSIKCIGYRIVAPEDKDTFGFTFATALLQCLPLTCKAASFEISPRSNPWKFPIADFLHDHPHLETQLTSLTFTASGSYDPNHGPFIADGEYRYWCGIISHFKTLRHLSIVFNIHGNPLTAFLARRQQAFWDREADVFPHLRLPSVLNLTLSQGMILVSHIDAIALAFPNLQTLEIDNMAVRPAVTYPDNRPTDTRHASWLEISQQIRQSYGGRCRLSFIKDGPFMEIDGRCHDSDAEHGYAIEPHWAIDRTLKRPILRLLEDLSSAQDSSAALQLRQTIQSMTDHTPPNVSHHWRFDQPNFQQTKIIVVETEGVRYSYYRTVILDTWKAQWMVC